MTRYDAPYKRKTRTYTTSLLMLKQVLRFPTDPNAERQSESVNCSDTNIDNVGISAFLLSLVPVIIQNYRMKGINRP